MGDCGAYQPLTREDRVTVVIYRCGIVLSSLVVALLAYALLDTYSYAEAGKGLKLTVALGLLYVAVGLSVFFIHLYVGSFHRGLKKLYYVSIAALAVLLVSGSGDLLKALSDGHAGPLLLLPLAGCLGFITAKEAFCFKLTEGYIIALVMPLYLLFLAAGSLTREGVSYGLAFIAVLLVIFTLRKVFMPIHCDIGDKSAYS